MTDNEKVWGGVTDPSRHDEKNFRYLVHAFHPLAKAFMVVHNAQAVRSKMEHGEGHEIDRAHGDQSIDLYEEPERVAERISLSMSLIDQDHPATWGGNAGIIVEAPEQNIIITSPQDVGCINFDPEFIRKQALQHPHLDGDKLLKASEPTTYNEVVALAKVGDSKLKLKGIFYKVTSKGEPIDLSLAKKMKLRALRLGIPVIEVKEIARYQANEVEDADGKLAVNLNGNRYLLGGYGDRNFRVHDEKRYGDFISPDELKSALKFLHDKDFSDDRIGEIERDYALADMKYHRARFMFDETGEINELNKREGYGENEQKYSVGPNGYSNVVGFKESKRLFTDIIMENREMHRFERDMFRPVTRRKVEEMIEEAKQDLSPEQLEKVEKWADKILPNVERKEEGIYRK